MLSDKIVQEIQAALRRKPGVEIDPRGMYFSGCDSFTVRSPSVQLNVAVERGDSGHVLFWLDREDVYVLSKDPPKNRLFCHFWLELQDSKGETFEVFIEHRTNGPRLRDYKVSWTTSGPFTEERLDRLVVFVSAVLDRAAELRRA